MENNLEEQLEKNIVRIKPSGYSMYPVIVPGRDYVYIDKADFSSLKKGDVVLYRDSGKGSIYVLHRICKITVDGIYTVGDNQSKMEGPFTKEQIIGRMVAMDRNGKHIEAGNVIYRTAAGIWLAMRVIRRPVSLLVHKVKSVFRKR